MLKNNKYVKIAMIVLFLALIVTVFIGESKLNNDKKLITSLNREINKETNNNKMEEDEVTLPENT